MQSFKEHLTEWLFSRKKKEVSQNKPEHKPVRSQKRYPPETKTRHGITYRDLNDHNDHEAPTHRLKNAALQTQYRHFYNMNNKTPEQHARHKELEKERAHRGFKPRMEKGYSDNFQNVKPKHNIFWKDQHGNQKSGY